MQQVGDMTLYDLADMNAQWKKHPPTYLLIEGYVGFKPPEEPILVTDENIRELMGA